MGKHVLTSALPYVNVKNFGLKGDGTNETSLLLTALTYVADNNISLYIPKNFTITIDSITLLNKQNFGIYCEGTIKRMNNSPTIGALLKLDTCSNVVINEINFDGNGQNNGCVENVDYTSSQEQKHSLTLLGCTNVYMNKFHVLNACGDGIYISNNSKNIIIDTITAKATTQIGRNIVSIINAQDINIKYIYGDNFGHYQMPGGLDIEPNTNTDIVRNVTIGKVNITGGGTNPFSVMATNNSLVENIFVDSVNLIRTNTSIGASEVHSCLISASNVHINQLSVKNNTSLNINGIALTNHGVTPKGIYIGNALVDGSYRGIQVGILTTSVENVKIKATLRNTKFDGVNIAGCKNVYLDLDIDTVGASRFFVNKITGLISDNVFITGNISKRGTGLKALINSDIAANTTNWTLQNLDFTGWGNDERLYGVGWLGTVKKINCPNLTYLSAIPNFEQWKVGDKITNTTPTELGTTPNKYIVEGWVCITDGAGSTKFREARVFTGN